MTVPTTSLVGTAAPADSSSHGGATTAGCADKAPAGFLRTSKYIDCAEAGVTITETARHTGASISAVKMFAHRYPEIKFKGQCGPRKVET